MPFSSTRRRLLLASSIGAGSAALSGCASPVAVIDALTPRDTYRLLPDQAYWPGSADPRHRLDVYQPLADSLRPWPLLVFFYGGSWNSGARQDYRFVGEALAARGILTLIADYRLYPQVSYPDFLYDSAAATAWALARAEALGGDASRVFVMGHSAGAYNAAMVALDPRWLGARQRSPAALRGWIGLAGPYDFLPVDIPAVKPVFHHPHEPPDSQPLAHAHDAPASAQRPVFLGVSRQDDYVDPLRNSLRLAQALREAGTPVDLRWYERTSHLTLLGAFSRPLRWLAPVLEDVVGFVQRV